jgi:pimeloyl-ACP methyl ester carboxylesterase
MFARALAILVVAAGCHGHAKPTAPAPDATARQLSLLFVHGVDSGSAARATAQDALIDLETYVTQHVAGIAVQSRRVNLYTDLAGNVLSPSIDSPSDGTGVPSALKWRAQLALKLAQAYPNGERDIVVIGHSTGGRAAMEVAANVGADGQPGNFDWGVADRIAGVITLDAILHDLESNDFNFIGPLDFITGCKVAQETGWCEYAGLISGVPAADAVTRDGRSLVLIAAGDCSPSVWTGESDQVVPLLAQGCPAAPGTHVTPSKNGDVIAPGFYYGPFCHSDTTNRSSPRHASAIAAAGDAMATWLTR